ncbi:MAG TPA: hypothetical protein VMA77_04830 [Solirubrobacteraceae bacterium]|nr:hypothetical protein [Solirubrobacteraceae bacterium]
MLATFHRLAGTFALALLLPFLGFWTCAASIGGICSLHERKPVMPIRSGPLSVAIADVFNHAFQSHSDDAPNEEVLAEVAEGIAAILAAAGYCTERAFMEGTLLRARVM